MRRSLKR
jgi:hypothetical protein